MDNLALGSRSEGFADLREEKLLEAIKAATGHAHLGNAGAKRIEAKESTSSGIKESPLGIIFARKTFEEAIISQVQDKLLAKGSSAL